jgi:hypothetical protein
LILGFALVGWVFTTAMAVVLRRPPDDTRPSRVKRFAALFASQYVIQALLAFPIPFFWRAASPVVGHVVFGVAYVVVVVVVFWDPFFARLAVRPWALVFTQAFAAFVALLTVLPVVGLDNGTTFVVAGAVVAVAAPVGIGLSGGTIARRGSLAGGFALALGVLTFLGAPLVPAAPLSLTTMVLARGVDDRVPVDVATSFVPGEVVCFTAIGAPLGLNDALVHVWLRGDREVQRVTLDVRGGRAAGFRTWSRLSRATPGPLRCRVETARGQVLGVVDGVVRGAP